MKKVRVRLGMMCDLDSTYDPRLVSDIEVDDEEAKRLEELMNENREVVLMGRFPATMMCRDHGFLDKPYLGK